MVYGSRRGGRLSHASIVKDNQAIVRGEQWDKLAPVRVVARKARDEQQWLAGSALFIEQLDSVCLDLRHTLRTIVAGVDACSRRQTRAAICREGTALKARLVVVAGRPGASPPPAKSPHDDEDIVATAPSWTTVAEVRRGAKRCSVAKSCAQPAGVKPGTISNLATNSPIRDPATGAKSTVTAA